MRLAYWRDDPFEVDFVISQGPRALGIEVKSGRSARAMRGLAEFKKRFPTARTLLVVGSGTEGQIGRRGGRPVVPLNEFLAAPASHWLKGES